MDDIIFVHLWTLFYDAINCRTVIITAYCFKDYDQSVLIYVPNVYSLLLDWWTVMMLSGFFCSICLLLLVRIDPHSRRHSMGCSGPWEARGTVRPSSLIYSYLFQPGLPQVLFVCLFVWLFLLLIVKHFQILSHVFIPTSKFQFFSIHSSLLTGPARPCLCICLAMYGGAPNWPTSLFV